MTMRRRALLSIVAIAVTAPVLAAPLTLDQLMQTLATLKSGRAGFVEERRIVSLDQGQLATPPQILRSTGELSFEAPDRFERRTLAPRDERLAVDGNTLTMSRSGRSRTVQLDSVPEAQAMVEAIRGTLTGNGAVLQRYFDAKVDGTLADWRLTLAPKDERLRGSVKSIAMRGRQALLREVTLQLADGDSSVMTIAQSPIAPSTLSQSPIQQSPDTGRADRGPSRPDAGRGAGAVQSSPVRPPPAQPPTTEPLLAPALR